jgi:cell division protein FtsW
MRGEVFVQPSVLLRLQRMPTATSDSTSQRGPLDPWLLLAVVVLVLIGEVMVFSTSYFYAGERFNEPYRFFWKHQLAVLLGGAGLMIALAIPSQLYHRFTYPLLALAFISLVIVFVPGVSHGKVHRWIHAGPINFQPSELAKGAAILYLATSLTKKADRIDNFANGVLPHLVIVGAIALLIALEPDLGGAVSVCLVFFAMLFVAGTRLQHLLGLCAGGILLFIVAAVTANYRLDRIIVFIGRLLGGASEHNQGIGYQLNQSLLAFGAGGVNGVGLGESRQKLWYLPEAHTDFIFAVIGEETGLWGTGVIIILFALLGIRGLRVAMRHPQPFGRLLAFGCTFLLVCQAGLNMGVVLGLLPTKGLPLPFISYGGSALVTALIYAGILLSLSREALRENHAYA